ncbi:hypothetical protein [Anaerotignum sp.]
MKYTIPLKAATDYLKHYDSGVKPEHCIFNLIPTKGKITLVPSQTTESDVEPYKDNETFEITRVYHCGGTVVVFEDTVCFAEFDDKPPKGRRSDLVKFLQEKGIDAYSEGNDIICDGFKVAGDSRLNLGDTGYSYYCLFVSISSDIDVINKICQKPMSKPPRGLAYYGITRQEILDVLGVFD